MAVVTNIDDGGRTSEALAHISALTGAKIRVFLTEIAEGVSNYRSLHSLTQQVEHQYHGRFLIELIQNAHDALAGAPLPNKPNRIEIVFDPEDSPHGSLFVANDGEPFSSSNFERLAQLGQSDKDPEKSIGNKGIGFRSVLEVSECPEVYSRASPSSKSFDGYCFAFRPEVVESLVKPMVQLAKQGSIPASPVSEGPLVDWSEDMLTKFRRRVRSHPDAWLVGEAKYLSPYLLPVPLTRVDSATVKSFDAQGFATVVRLPLKSSERHEYVLKHMQQLSSSTVLFLDKVSSLNLRVIGGDERFFARASSILDGDSTGVRVTVDERDGAHREYSVWSRGLHIPSASEEFRAAVRALPGRWPEIVDISVSIAVRLGDVPEAGIFSIYLPTLLPTGSAVHVNGPFFGDMSRASIPFDDAYNRQLLQTAGDLAFDVVRNRLAGKGPAEARVIVDLLAPYGQDGNSTTRWTTLISEAASRVSASLDDEPLILAEEGWRALNATSLVPAASKATLLTESVLRRHATFDIFHLCLNSRCEQLKDLAKMRGYETGAFPSMRDVAATIASVASELRDAGGDWNAFWRDVILLLPIGQQALAEHEVLVGSDGKLHNVSPQSTVYFLQRQGTSDDGDVGGERGTTEVPPSLQPNVAFLSDKIQLYDPNKLTVQNAVRTYLGNGLVSQFRVETIFNGVLKELTPPLPVSVNGPHFELCRDIMRWAMRLIGNVVARGRGAETTLKLLRIIPVPCEGGWFPMDDASFGEGWPDTSGLTLKFYLDALAPSSAAEARKRLLLPPGNPAWDDVGVPVKQLLQSGGVFDGLRLKQIASDTWGSEFKAASHFFQLPTRSPPTISKEQWVSYRALVEADTRPTYSSLRPYVVGTLYTFPGFADAASLSEEARLALSELVLQSLPYWGPGLEPVAISKKGGYWDRLQVTSPLKHFLQSTAWLATRDAKGWTWSCPAERWHVPADALAGRARHFAHLKALPSALAKRLDARPELAKALRTLGMPYFDLHSETGSPRLIEALTASVGSDDVSDLNVLLGQLRDAWNRFRPAISQPPLEQLAVRRRDKRLEILTPTNEAPVFLPDSGTFVAELEQFNFPVLTIYPSDAKDLREWFGTAYGSRVQLTSTLTLVPQVDGAEWSGVSAVALADSELAWLIRPLLALVAFHGQFRGIHSKAFQERVDLLREVRIDWVPTAQVAVMRGTTVLATAEVPSLWDAQRKVIIATELCRANPAELSTAFAQALERDDLELPLKYALRSVDSVENEPEDLATFLAPLGVSPEQIHQVIEHLRGDVGQMVNFVRVLVEVLAPQADMTAILGSKTEEELGAALAAANIANLDTQRTLRLASEQQDMFEFGRSMSRDLGKIVSLTIWNQSLRGLGQRQLTNRSWATEFQAGLEEASSLVKRVLAHLIRHGNTDSFAQLWLAYSSLPRTVDLSKSCWQVDFQTTMGVVADLIQSWKGIDNLADAMRESVSSLDLRERLLALAIPLDIDPDECSRTNHQLVEAVVSRIERLRLAWWLKTAANKQNGDWHDNAEKYRAAATAPLSGDGFTRIWSEVDVFALLRGSAQQIGADDFTSAMSASVDIASLQSALAISAEELSGAEERLATLKAESNRRRNIVKVCDEDFDSSEDNLGQLWGLLHSRIPDEAIANCSPLNLGKTIKLRPVKAAARKSRADMPRHPQKTQRRQSKSVDEVVGMAGEIFVYRMLQKEYGSDVVSSSTWVSENGTRIFPHNQADDGMGCDFAFTANGKLLRVEVKSTAGDDEAFTLGSSEIRLAMELGVKRKRRREVFLLVHVKNALSTAPSAVVLPNPYDPRYAALFSTEEADARVRYRAMR